MDASAIVELRIINGKQLIFIKELGEGAFGRVYLGSCINLFTGEFYCFVNVVWRAKYGIYMLLYK